MNIRVGHHCRNHQVCLDLWLIAASFDLHRLTRQQTACTEHKHSQPSFHSLPPFSPVFCQRKTKWRTTTPRICFPPRLIFSSPLDRVRGVFDCVMTRIESLMPLVHGM